MSHVFRGLSVGVLVPPVNAAKNGQKTVEMSFIMFIMFIMESKNPSDITCNKTNDRPRNEEIS